MNDLATCVLKNLSKLSKLKDESKMVSCFVEDFNNAQNDVCLKFHASNQNDNAAVLKIRSDGQTFGFMELSRPIAEISNNVNDALQEGIKMLGYLIANNRQNNGMDSLPDETKKSGSNREIIQKEKLYKREQDRLFINTIIDAINEGRHLGDVLKLISKLSKKLFSGFGFVIFLVDENEKNLELHNFCAISSTFKRVEKFSKHKLTRVKIPLTSDHLFVKILNEQKPHLADTPEMVQRIMTDFAMLLGKPGKSEKNSSKTFDEVTRLLGLNFILTIPLVSAGKSIGLLDISGKQPLNDFDKDRILSLSHILTAIISRQQHEAKLHQDISERKQQQEALMISEERFRDLAKLLPQVIFEADLESRLTFVNDVAFQIFGLLKKDFERGISIFDTIIPGDRLRARQNIQHILQGKKTKGNEYTAVRKDGSTFPVIVYTNAVIRNNQPVGLRGVVVDITERKRYEEALQQEKAFSDAIINSLPGIFFVYDEDSKLARWNKNYETATGYTAAELRNKHYMEWFDGKDLEIAQAGIEEISRVGKTTITACRRMKDGRKVPYHYSGLMLKMGGTRYIMGVGIDISARTKAEEALVKSESFNRRLVESAPIGILFLDDKGVITYENPAMARMMNVPENIPSPVIGKKLAEIPYIKNNPLGEKVCERILNGEKIIGEFFHYKSIFDKDIDLEIHAAPIYAEKGQVSGSILMVHDVTRQREIMAALSRSEEKFRNLAENIPGVIYLRSTESPSSIIYLNDAVGQLTGYSKEEFLNNEITFRELHDDNDRDRIRSIIDRAIAKRQPFHLNYRIKNKKGGCCWIEEYGTGVFQDGKLVYIEGFLADISERKRAEEQIAASLKEKETLLKEVHHRVKNNLQIVSSLLNLQAAQIKDEETLKTFLESRNRIYSMALVHEKLYQSNNFSNINYKEYIWKMSKELFRIYTTSGTIQCEISIDDEHLDIDKAIPCGLIVTELLSNALKYAFPNGKKGTISISFKSHADAHELIIEDDGIGFPDHIDFPNSDSLGLQLVNVLVNQLDGQVLLQKTPGTRFEIIFPN